MVSFKKPLVLSEQKKYYIKLGMVLHPVIPALRRHKQEDHEFEVSLKLHSETLSLP
jgi:hypothetical protein